MEETKPLVPEIMIGSRSHMTVRGTVKKVWKPPQPEDQQHLTYNIPGRKK